MADELSKAYIAATNEIKTEIRKIFSGFKLEYGLSESAAFRLLTKRGDSPDLDSLKSLVAAMEDGPAKKELQAILASPAYAYRIRRFQQLQKDIDKKIQELAGTEEAITREHYVTLAGEAYDHSIFDVQKGTGIGFSFAEMPKSMVEEILRNKWSGALFSERIWKNLNVANQTIKEELLVGFMTGRSYRKTAKCIEKRMAVGSMEARRLVRTESTYIACMAELESCKEMGFKQYQYVATLDMRTSEMCAAMDRKIFDVEDGVPGYNMPPLHPWCRSTIIAYMEERDLSRLTRSARDPETGKLYEVPADMTYEEWKKSLDKERGAGYVDKRRRMAANETADREQYDRYLKVLGKKNLPKTFDKFQDLKYNRISEYEDLKYYYANINGRPIEYVKIDRELEKLGITNKGKAYPVEDIEVKGWRIHAENRMKQSGISREDALVYKENAIAMMKRYPYPQTVYDYYSDNGVVGVKVANQIIQTVIAKDRIKSDTETVIEVMKKWLK